MTEYTMAKMIADSALWFTQFVDWAGELGAMVVGSPIMLAGILIGFGYAGIALFKSFAHR